MSFLAHISFSPLSLFPFSLNMLWLGQWVVVCAQKAETLGFDFSAAGGALSGTTGPGG